MAKFVEICFALFYIVEIAVIQNVSGKVSSSLSFLPGCDLS